MPDESAFTLTLEQREGFEFCVKFDWPNVADLLLDEPEPLGARRGPNAARVLAVAVANCLSASLVFCMRDKFKQHPGPLRARVSGRLARNPRGRMRVAGLDVRIELADDAGAIRQLDRCVAQFEDFCVVTDSIRKGIPVRVQVVDASGNTVHESTGAA